MPVAFGAYILHPDDIFGVMAVALVDGPWSSEGIFDGGDFVFATTLEDKITTIDDAFTRPWTIHQRYRHNAENIVWVEYVCAEGNRHLKLGDEWYFLNDAEGILEPTREGQPRLVPETRVKK